MNNSSKVLSNSAPADTRHFLRRLAFTSTPEAERQIKETSVEAALDALAAAAKRTPPPNPPSWIQGEWRNEALRFADTPPTEGVSKRAAVAEANRKDVERLRQWWLNELIRSRAPLRENLVLFLHSMFGMATGTVDMSHALYANNRLLRQMCFGTVPALLEQLAVDPAAMMLVGLDEHRKVSPSDRPAQLILENWTVGEGAFTSDDVRNLSRALTGWVLTAPKGYEPSREVDLRAPRSSRRTGLRPVFQPEHFDDRPKTILGSTSNFGSRDAMRFLGMHNATAMRFSRLLIRHFGVEDPDRRLEASLVETYTRTEGSIEALLRQIVVSDEFWSPASRWNLIKSPVHLAVAACRQLEVEKPSLVDLSTWLDMAGQQLFDTNFTSGGWPGQREWISSADRLAVRYRLGQVLAGAQTSWGLAGSKVPPGGPAREFTGKAIRSLSGGALLARLDPAPGIDAPARAIHDAILEIVASPNYQLA